MRITNFLECGSLGLSLGRVDVTADDLVTYYGYV